MTDDHDLPVRPGWTEPLEVELRTPRRAHDRDALARQLLRLADADGAALFGVWDAARWDRVVPVLVGGDLPFESLYRGLVQEKYFSAGPFLARCRAGSEAFATLATAAWGHGCAVFFASPRPFEEVRDHLRRLLFVRRPTADGGEEIVFFRFYDPRVLRPFLPSCTSRELELVYGPIARFLVESEPGDAILEFDRRPRDSVGAQPEHPPEATSRHPGRPAAPASVPPLLTVQPEQRAALKRSLLSQFENQAVRHARRRHREATRKLSPVELRALVRRGLAQARSYDINVKPHLLEYLGFAFRHGHDFDRSAWAAAVLDDRSLPGYLKLDALRASEVDERRPDPTARA